MVMRLPRMTDHVDWVNLRRESEKFLEEWEPIRASDHYSRRAFRNRVFWSQTSVEKGTAMPVFLIRREDEVLLGAITLDNIRRGPAQAGTIGYWIGERYARKGYMREGVQALVNYAFNTLDLSRIEAACLPENKPSRALLEKCGFKYEGVAQSYLQIGGRWRTHVLYANLRGDRRGKTDVG
jgi:[ribosomal protein S5]-alanine N-acetyltransferase